MKDDTQLPGGGDMAAVLGMGQAKRGLPKISRKWVIIGLAALVVLYFAVGAFSGPAGPKYQTSDVTRGGIISTVTATGTLQPVNTVELGPEISGQISKVFVDFNDRVKTGQILAVMDTDTLKARVLQSRASLASARARVEDAKATAAESKLKLGRVRDLSGRGNASKQELDTAEAAEARARAGVTNAQAQVDVAAATLVSDETSLTKTEIKSPIDGIVLSRTVEPGQVVAATFQTPTLFKLAEDLTAMQLLVDVDEADIGHVQEGQLATFTVDAFQDRQFPATITQVRFAPKTVDSVVTYQAVLAVDNKELILRPGMTATATITTATRNDATLLPNGALRFQAPASVVAGKGDAPQPPGLFRMFAPPIGPETKQLPKNPGAMQRVWTLNGTVLTPVEVKIGLSDGQHTELVAGNLKAGDKVVVGLQKLPSR